MRRRARLFYYFIGIAIIFLCTSVQGRYLPGQGGEIGMDADGRFAPLKGPVLSMDIKDEPLKDVLERISDQNSITFSLPPSLGEEKVMIRFSNLTLEECLVKLLAPYNRIFIYKDDRSDPASPVRRLTEVRIFPHQYEGRVQEPVMNIAAGAADIKGEVSEKGSRKDTKKSTAASEKRKKTYIEDLTTTLQGRDREAKLDALQVLKDSRAVGALGALSVGMRDRDPRVQQEAVEAIKKLGEDLVVPTDTEDSPDPPPEEAESNEPQDKAAPSQLSMLSGSDNGAVIGLQNDVPVKGVQFTLKGAQPTSVRTTARSEGFFASFDQTRGRILLLNPSGGTISPGSGPIVEVDCANGGSARISEKIIVER